LAQLSWDVTWAGMSNLIGRELEARAALPVRPAPSAVHPAYTGWTAAE
jgi:hypothetical protein